MSCRLLPASCLLAAALGTGVYPAGAAPIYRKVKVDMPAPPFLCGG